MSEPTSPEARRTRQSPVGDTGAAGAAGAADEPVVPAIGAPGADPVQDGQEGRVQCYRCHRPAALCLCAHVPRLANRTGVWILQHPRERFHPLGTERFLHLGLERCHTDVAHGAEPRSVARAPFVPPGTAMLYPAADAPYLEDLAPEERPKDLLVVDGTWSQSRALVRQNPWLRDLPHVQIRPAKPSIYRVRREPRAHFVSTLEAVVYALSVVEPETDLSPLLDAFERLMDDHIAQHASGRQVRSKRPRKRRSRAVPEVLHAEPERLALLYMEPSLSWERPRARLPVQICARRLSDGRQLQVFVHPHGTTPGASHLAHMELEAGDYQGALDLDSALGELREFLGDRVIVGWNRTPVDLLRAAGVEWQDWVSLKTVYCNLRHCAAGSLESVLEKEGIATSAESFAGRAAKRMANASSLLDLLRNEAERDALEWASTEGA